MRCCVRRSFDAATISIAFVIFCVLFTRAILVRISLPLAIRLSHRGGAKPHTSVAETRRKSVPAARRRTSLCADGLGNTGVRLRAAEAHQYVPVFLNASRIFFISATFASLYSGFAL